MTPPRRPPLATQEEKPSPAVDGGGGELLWLHDAPMVAVMRHRLSAKAIVKRVSSHQGGPGAEAIGDASSWASVGSVMAASGRAWSGLVWAKAGARGCGLASSRCCVGSLLWKDLLFSAARWPTRTFPPHTSPLWADPIAGLDTRFFFFFCLFSVFILFFYKIIWNYKMVPKFQKSVNFDKQKVKEIIKYSWINKIFVLFEKCSHI